MSDRKDPFEVQTTAGSFVKGYDSLEQAESSAAERNKRAEEMELEAPLRGHHQVAHNFS